MIKIHGLKISNYSCIVRFALLEKGIDHEWIDTFPYTTSGDKAVLEKSTFGAVPILEYENQFISETFAILSFLEKKFPEKKMISDDALEHAKTIEFIKIFELYVDAQARNFYNYVFFGGEKKEDKLDEVKKNIYKALSFIEKKGLFDPYILENFSYADIYASMALFPTNAVCKEVYNWDVFEDFKKIAHTVEIINSRDSAKTIYSDIAKGMEELKKG